MVTKQCSFYLIHALFKNGHPLKKKPEDKYFCSVHILNCVNLRQCLKFPKFLIVNVSPKKHTNPLQLLASLIPSKQTQEVAAKAADINNMKSILLCLLSHFGAALNVTASSSFTAETDVICFSVTLYINVLASKAHVEIGVKKDDKLVIFWLYLG